MKILIILFLYSFSTFANDLDDNSYLKRTKLSPTNYLLGEHAPSSDPVFEGQNRHIDLGVDLAIGSDCGRVDFKSTLRATLKNLLDAEYFGDMGKDIIAASPMLVTCYFSPTWCSILKHTRVSANWLSKLRLDQCSLIDKYTDSRVEEFYAERQECIHKSIKRNGGNMENAMQECGNSNMWKYDLSDWAGKGSKVKSNKLIESSANWAGFRGEESSKTVKLIKSMVGDTVVSKGNISVDYGPRKIALTPRLHLMGIKGKALENLCQKLLTKVESRKDNQDIHSIVTAEELQEISGHKTEFLVDRQTIRSLSFMPYRERNIACEKLASAIALTRFTNEMNQSIDLLDVAAQNPNLPEKRKKELQNKKRTLGESINLTLQLYQNKNEPLNKVLSAINDRGAMHIDRSTSQSIGSELNQATNIRIKNDLWDCADGIMCSKGDI